MQNYNEIITKVRDLARDQVRLQAVNRYRTKRYEAEKALASLDEQEASIKKDIARYEFKKSQLVEADPDFAEKTESIEKAIVSLNEEIEHLAKVKENGAQVVADLDEKIAKVESGETKMDIEKVEAAAKQLIDEFVKSQAAEIAA